MANTLGKRIAALEQSSPEGLDILVVVPMTTAAVQPEIVAYGDGSGWSCSRLPAESADAFHDRAVAEARKVFDKCTILFARHTQSP